jgi:hypothetical protein
MSISAIARMRLFVFFLFVFSDLVVERMLSAHGAVRRDGAESAFRRLLPGVFGDFSCQG